MKERKIICMAALSAVLLNSCQVEKRVQEAVNYSVVTLSPTDVTLSENYSATVRGRQDIEIYPQVSGTIKQVCVTEGQRVHKGQTLFIIDQVPYQAALRTAIANVHAAEAQVETAVLDYQSKQVLFDEQVISNYELSTARNVLAVAQATL